MSTANTASVSESTGRPAAGAKGCFSVPHEYDGRELGSVSPAQLFADEILRYLDHALWLTDIPAYGRRKDSEPHHKHSAPIFAVAEYVASSLSHEAMDHEFMTVRNNVRALAQKVASDLELIILQRFNQAIGKTNRKFPAGPNMLGILTSESQGWIVVIQFDNHSGGIRIDFPYTVERTPKEGLYDGA